MKLKFIIIGSVIVGAVLFALSKTRREDFAPAKDFPRAALVYVQVEDLPALIKLWDESRFKENYLESKNFQDFKNRHLGLKLAGRWEEFNTATGFPVDLKTLSGLADKRAAVALYDIGKLDFVFIAPVSDEIFAAAAFVQNKSNFEEQTLDDGTIIYRAAVAADSGRQKQELIFTNVKGRFILATSEKLLAQTLNNINGKTEKSRLPDDPLFKTLSEKIEPHLATVWVRQTALNDDYYFKRYWLTSDFEEIKNISAGIFDFSLEENRLIEQRKFLLGKTPDKPKIDSAQAAEMLTFLPDNIPFYRLQAADRQTVNAAIEDMISDRQTTAKKNGKHYRGGGYYSYDDFDERNYSYLDSKFDETISEFDEDEAIEEKNDAVDFAGFLQAAKPQIVMTFGQPEILPAPLFVEFRRGAVINLNSADNFDRASFERAAAQSTGSKILISAPNVNLEWKTKNEDGVTWRELELPVLGWSVCYMVKGRELIISNNSEFLRKINVAQNSRPKAEKYEPPVNELTVLDLNQKENAFSRVFAGIAAKNNVSDFFTGNIESLLSAASEIGKVEVKKSCSGNFLDEQVILNFK